MPDIGARTSEVKERIRGVVGLGEVPVATDAEGRVQIVRDALQAFGDGDFDRFFGSMEEEVEWVAPEGSNFPGGGTHHGREAVAECLLEDVKRSYTSFGFQPQKYLETEGEDLVMVLGGFTGEGIESGGFEIPGVQIWEFENGKVIRIRTYADSAGFPKPREEEDEQDEEQEQEPAEKAQAGESEGGDEEEERQEREDQQQEESSG